MASEEPYGTTPIPTASSSGGGSLEVTLDLWSKTAEVAQQPQTQQIAVYEAKPDEECINGSLLDVNQHFVVYAVKNGLIRVLHRHSSLKALLRGHQGHVVTDISFFLDGDVLATVGHSLETGVSKLIVWRVFEQSPEIQSEKLLEVSSDSAPMNRLLWHPFNPNQLWVLHGMGGTNTDAKHQVATLVETTRIQTITHPEESHPVCRWHSPTVLMEGGIQLNIPDGSLEDLAWSGRDTRHVLTVHSNGQIILWDLKQTEDSVDAISGVSIAIPKKLAVLAESPDTPQSRCMFMPHENAVRLEGQMDTLTSCFVTASHKNTVITLWSSFTTTPGNLPVKLQVLKLANPSPSYALDVCFGPAPQEASPPSCFILWADRHQGRLLAIHVASQWSLQNKALCVGGDYVVPFVLHYPIYSWCVMCAPTQDISDEDIAEHQGLIFDMKLFAYQSKAIQCLTLTSYMCLPPEHSYNEKIIGVSSRALLDDGAMSSELGSIEPEYDEEYDVDDEDLDEDDDDDHHPEAPAAYTLPVPPAPIAAGVGSNPFANWLGAIAGGTITSTIPPPLPPAATTLPPPGMAVQSVSNEPTSQPLLNPLDLLHNVTQEKEPASRSNSSSNSKGRAITPNKTTKSKPKKTRSKSPKTKNRNKKDTISPFPDGAKISILKREDAPAPPTRAFCAPSAPLDPAIIDPAIASVLPPLPSSMPMPIPMPATNANLEETLCRVLSEEFAKQPTVSDAVEQALAAKLVPAVNKVVQESLVSFGRPLQSSMDRLGQQGVRVDPKDLQAALDLETPIKAALADTVRNVFIPAMESITAQILKKVTPPLPPPVPAPDKGMMAALETLTQQLATMNSKMEGMAKEIKTLKSSSVPNLPMPPPPAQLPAPVNQVEAARHEINALLQQNQFQAAFTKAVSTSNAEMAVYVCSRANLNAVLGGSAPKLSQPILLCLMQQLGASLATTNSPEILGIELEWLQEIALVLNPADPNIQRHVPQVLQQLVGSVNHKITQGHPQLRRPLQMLLQVLRGMQMG